MRLTTTGTIQIKYNDTNNDAITITSTESPYIEEDLVISNIYVSSTAGATITLLLKYIQFLISIIMTATSKEVEILEKRYNDLSIEMVNGQNEVEGLRTISKNLKKENTDFQKKNDVLDKGIEENQIILKQQKDDHDIYIQ